jgi:hypothetical protein
MRTPGGPQRPTTGYPDPKRVKLARAPLPISRTRRDGLGQLTVERPFDEYDVAPLAVVAPNALADADHAESGALVRSRRGPVVCLIEAANEVGHEPRLLLRHPACTVRL